MQILSRPQSSQLAPTRQPFVQSLTKSPKFGYDMGYGNAATTTTTNAQGQSVTYTHNTGMFRNPVVFKALTTIIQQKYPQHAHIDCYGASDGSEQYSLAAQLVQKLGARKAANYPINGYDLVPSVIADARSGKVNIWQNMMQDMQTAGLVKHACLYGDTVQIINSGTPLQDAVRDNMLEMLQREKVGRFIDFNPVHREPISPHANGSLEHYRSSLELGRFPVKDVIKRNVTFRVDDFTSRAESSFAEPTILITRNMWYHFKDQAAVVARNLYENMGANDLLVLGQTEQNRRNGCNALEALTDAGFIALSETELLRFGVSQDDTRDCRNIFFIKPSATSNAPTGRRRALSLNDMGTTIQRWFRPRQRSV